VPSLDNIVDYRWFSCNLVFLFLFWNVIFTLIFSPMCIICEYIYMLAIVLVNWRDFRLVSLNYYIIYRHRENHLMICLNWHITNIFQTRFSLIFTTIREKCTLSPTQSWFWRFYLYSEADLPGVMFIIVYLYKHNTLRGRP